MNRAIYFGASDEAPPAMAPINFCSLSKLNRIRHFLFRLSIAAIAAFAGLPLWAQSIESEGRASLPPDEIIVKYKSLNRFAEHGPVLRRVGPLTSVVRHEGGRFRMSGADKWRVLHEKIKAIKQDDNVLYAEPNYLGRFEETVPPAPNDPNYASQWWLPAVGDRAMWALGRGDGVVVAVIDTGADLTHPDLKANLLANGWNFGDDNATPQDVMGHGTKVVGIIAALRNNAVGVVGLAPEAKILPLKINVGGGGTFTSDRLAQAIAYAVKNGAKIINLSLTVDNETQTVRDAVSAALKAGVVMVAASGNEGGVVAFPANMPGVIGVASTDQSNKLASFSNAGPEVTVAAPGVNIYSTSLGGGYGSASGTSFSAPIVSAAIADMMSINPALPVTGFAKYLRDNTVAVVGGTQPFGILNGGKAANSLIPHLLLSKQQFSSLETLPITYTLPPTGGATDVYVAVQTPAGEYTLHPDGHWTLTAITGYVPFAVGFSAASPLSGTLFGIGGAFDAIPLVRLPGGAYTWRIAMVGSDTHKIVGDVITTTMSLSN